MASIDDSFRFVLKDLNGEAELLKEAESEIRSLIVGSIAKQTQARRRLFVARSFGPVVRLRGQGLTFREIGDSLGFSRQYAHHQWSRWLEIKEGRVEQARFPKGEQHG